MKCLILAGGHGERLWPLSRKNYPKQFIEIQKNHSIFQETVARNIPYCDEFIIVTSYEYRYIIANQMKVFQGTSYRCVFEENPKKTTAAILLACLGLPASEYVFVVAADHLIDTKQETEGDLLSYKDAILKAKAYAQEGRISLFGKADPEPDSRFGYICTIRQDGTIVKFQEKPDANDCARLLKKGELYRNLGMMVFQNGILKKELLRRSPIVVWQCQKAYDRRRILGNDTYYSAQVQSIIEPIPIEKVLLERSSAIRAVRVGFEWSDIGSLEDLRKTDIQSVGPVVSWECSGSMVVNESSRQAVVMNGLEDVLVVNTPDAVYVGKYGNSDNLKEILHAHGELAPYTEKGTMYFRSWGTYKRYVEDPDHWVQELTMLPGKTLYQHKHLQRTEVWTVIRGSVLVSLDGESRIYGPGEMIQMQEGCVHQASNVGDEPAVILEVVMGKALLATDLYGNQRPDVAETELGWKVDPMVKLKPAFMDALWGGSKLRDLYHKECDYDVISESWELSAHPDGPSMVATGRHKGMKFNQYLHTVGKEILGWKCDPLQAFPLMVKFIDAKGDLSIQVHPDDEYALEWENQYGKNEMWYVVDAEPGAGLYMGFNRDMTREEVEQRVLDGSILEVLNFYPTRPGDVFFIPAGTVHAIGGGNLICEIQQSSNCTYRLYDYDRRDKFGNPRTLHLKKALDVLDYKKYVPWEAPEEDSVGYRLLCRCKYFESVLYEIQGTEKIQLQNDRFASIICITGSGILTVGGMSMEVKAGESVFLPASEDILAISGNLTVILSNI